MKPEPDRALVLGLWAHLADHYRTETVPKARSPLMGAASLGLSAVRILDRKRFMDGFTTVIGRRIYAPFEPGGGGSRTLLDQVVTCVHEHQHVVQLDRDGYLRMWPAYLGSSRARAMYEAEAYTCNLEVRWWFTGTHPDPAALAGLLRSYGCGEGDVAAATEVLARNGARVRAGEDVTEAWRVARAWLEAHQVGSS